MGHTNWPIPSPSAHGAIAIIALISTATITPTWPSPDAVSENVCILLGGKDGDFAPQGSLSIGGPAPWTAFLATRPSTDPSSRIWRRRRRT